MGFFPKIKSKEEKLEESLLKTKAEFSNYQRRTNEQSLKLRDMGAAKILEEILPSLNFFEMALSGSDQASDEVQNYLKGFEMINAQINMSLENAGVEKINKVGVKFDHNIHEAIETISDDTLENETVTQVRSAGFKYKGEVIVHAKVVINKIETEKEGEKDE